MRGQHFLVDGNFIDLIVRSAAIGPQHCVLEVGTGTGILTDALADCAGAVVTCDLDARLQAITRGLRAWPESVRFVAADILDGKHKLNPAVVDAWADSAGSTRVPKVVSNLPYSVATPLLANLLWDGLAFEDALVLVQKEAAERFVAQPGTSAYGPISVAVALLAEAEIVRHVGPQVFWPQPKVQSALMRLTPKRPDEARALKLAGLPALLRDGFKHRRKTLRKAFGAARLEAAGIDPGSRAEEVVPDLWLRLLTVPPS